MVCTIFPFSHSKSSIQQSSKDITWSMTLSERRSFIYNYALFPLFGFDFVQRTFLPLARRLFSTALPLVVLILRLKPWVLASDFRDLFLFVMQRAAFPALTWRIRYLSFTTVSDLKSTPRDKPEELTTNMLESTRKEHNCSRLYCLLLVTLGQKISWSLK